MSSFFGKCISSLKMQPIFHWVQPSVREGWLNFQACFSGLPPFLLGATYTVCTYPHASRSFKGLPLWELRLPTIGTQGREG